MPLSCANSSASEIHAHVDFPLGIGDLVDLLTPRHGSQSRKPPLGSGDGGDVPLPGHAFELMGAAVFEFESGPDYEVAQRVGHQYLVRRASALTRAPMCTPIPPMSSP